MTMLPTKTSPLSTYKARKAARDKAVREAMKMVESMAKTFTVTVEDLDAGATGEAIIQVGAFDVCFSFDSDWDIDVDPSFDGIYVEAELDEVGIHNAEIYLDGDEVSGLNEELTEIICEAFYLVYCEEKCREAVCEDDDVITESHRRSHRRQYAATYRW